MDNNENGKLNTQATEAAENAQAESAGTAEEAGKTVETGKAAEAAEGAAEEKKEPELTPEERAAQKKKKFWKEVREWIVSLAVALIVVFIIRTFLFQIIRVDGESMSTTLANNERLFVTVLDVKLNGASRNDIVICHYPNRGSTDFVKRVVAVPGDRVYRENGVTHVLYETTEADGTVTTVDEMLDERYALYYPAGSPDDYEPYTLGEDEYFVCGDNRYNSHDSRDWKDSDDSKDVGPITGNMIVGKVRCVIWPLSDIRSTT